MKKHRHDPIASLLADGEATPEQRSRLSDPAVRSEIAEIRRLSAELQVPADVSAPDPFFVVRFRQRRDTLKAAAQSAQSWRRAARYLLPLAASALLGAVLAVWTSPQRGNALGELEMRELGKGVADVTLETTSVEPVLRIALGEL
jgi:anti-sigma factor RsiW